MFVLLGDSKFDDFYPDMVEIVKADNYAVLDLDDLVCEVVSGRDFLRAWDIGKVYASAKVGLCRQVRFMNVLLEGRRVVKLKDVHMDRVELVAASVGFEPFHLYSVSTDVVINVEMTEHVLYVNESLKLRFKWGDSHGFSVKWVFNLGSGIYFIRLVLVARDIIDLFVDMLDGSLLHVQTNSGDSVLDFEVLNYGRRRQLLLRALAKWELLRPGIPLLHV